MKLIAYLSGIFVTALGVLGVASPRRLIPFARMFESRAGLNTAAALRLVLGTSLFLSALTCRIPKAIRVIGISTILSGVITPFIGVKRFGRILSWWEGKGSAFSRAWSMIALGLGIFLTWALTPSAGR
ncbi:MAG TPA: hypothetical protein PLF54_11085 [Deltaproteobacteria bacterium]|jgi:hypothetical protein|nr:hypothetical protein [Deltaproteobacteria bacterium]